MLKELDFYKTRLSIIMKFQHLIFDFHGVCDYQGQLLFACYSPFVLRSENDQVPLGTLLADAGLFTYLLSSPRQAPTAA
jgi:hypothetical protein